MMSMKMVVLDGYTLNPGDLDWQVLAPFGALSVYPSSMKEDVVARIGDAEVIFVNKTMITEEILAACQQIRYIGILATGYDNIDMEAVRRRGIAITNVPDYGGIAVAQHTMALLLELTNRTCANHERILRGEWSSITNPDRGLWQMEMTELAGKTIGFVGYGTIAIYAARMARAFDMRTLGYSRSEREEGRRWAEYVDLDTLLRENEARRLPHQHRPRRSHRRRRAGKSHGRRHRRRFRHRCHGRRAVQPQPSPRRSRERRPHPTHRLGAARNPRAAVEHRRGKPPGLARWRAAEPIGLKLALSVAKICGRQRFAVQNGFLVRICWLGVQISGRR